MKNIRRFAIASVALALGLPAVAQNVETANSTTTGRRASPVTAPAYTVHNTIPGAGKAVLKTYSNYVTQTGVGSGGADVSELYTTFTLGSIGYNVYGWGMQATAGNTLADDFTSTASWTVSDLYWLSYQTGAPTSGTITGMNMELWKSGNNPNGQIVGSGDHVGTGVWVGNTFTGVYRVLDSGLGAINRALIEVQCSVGAGWVPPFPNPLPAGQHWLSANATGSLSSGPWSPTAVEAGQVPPTGHPWDGMQAVGGGAFAPVFDTGFPAGSISEPPEWLFRIDGTTGGGPPTFCTSKPTSIPGCTPALSMSSASISKGGAGGETYAATPAPGGGNPGIFIYNRTGTISPPVSTGFGFICVLPFLRAGAFPQLPGGTSGTCTGAYGGNMGAIVAGTAPILVGDTTFWQLWYRDSPNPGGANMTNAVGPVAITP